MPRIKWFVYSNINVAVCGKFSIQFKYYKHVQNLFIGKVWALEIYD